MAGCGHSTDYRCPHCWLCRPCTHASDYRADLDRWVWTCPNGERWFCPPDSAPPEQVFK